MATKIGLPENMKRLKGEGIIHERSRSFDEGYNAGFDNASKYLREQLALEIEAEMRESKEFDTLNNARNTGLRRAAFIVRGGKKNGK